jgi:hypothetical protein
MSAPLIVLDNDLPYPDGRKGVLTRVVAAIEHPLGRRHLRTLQASKLGDAVTVRGLNQSREPLAKQILMLHIGDVPTLIRLLEYVLAGPLGRTAIMSASGGIEPTTVATEE